MRKLTITNNAGDGEEEEGGEEYQEEQWEESDRVAFVTSASEDGDIVLWDVKSKEILQRVSGVYNGVCFWVDVHGESGTMVSCGQDGRIVVFRHRYPEVEEVSLKVNGNGTTEEHGTTRYPEEEDEEEEGQSSEERAITKAEELPDVSMREDDEPVTTNGHSYPETAVGGADASVLQSNEGDVAMQG